MNIKKAKQTGFTIVELLIVVVVIAILAAITIVAYNGITKRASEAGVASHLSDLIKKVEIYNVENSAYPGYVGEISGAGKGDNYILAGNRYCVESTVSNTTYHRLSDSQNVVSGVCGNVKPNYPVASEACFNFNTSANAVIGYYDNQNNNPSSPACPLTLTMPASIGGVAVQSIEQDGFQNSKITGIVIPDSVTRIVHGGFYGSAVQFVHIPSSVTEISGNGFGASQLQTAYIPSSVSTLGCSTLRGIGPLKSISIAMDSTASSAPLTFRCGDFQDNPALKRIAFGGSVVELGTNLFSFFNTTGQQSALDDVFIADSNRELTITNAAFKDTSIKSFTLPGRTKEVSGSAFHEVSSLEELIINDSNTSMTISSAAFMSTSIKSLVIPGRVKVIDGGAFSDIPALTSLMIKPGVETLGPGAFYDIGSTSVSVPSATNVHEYAFNPSVTITRF